ncbi:MAG: hypothetical protein VZR73_07505 [Acutalibacteraceae bacterium]|nr:hypothetical protein [Acutalibacteraceae bacterium]
MTETKNGLFSADHLEDFFDLTAAIEVPSATAAITANTIAVAPALSPVFTS